MAGKDPYDLRDIFEDMTLRLIASLKRNLSRHEEEEERVGFRFVQWQLAKLRAMRRYRQENKRIIGAASAAADKLIDDVLQQDFETGQENVEAIAQKAVKITGQIDIPEDFAETIEPLEPAPKGRVQPRRELPAELPEENFFGINDKKLRALQDSVKGDLRKGNDAVMRKMDDVYRQVIFKAETQMAAGALTLDQAIDKATKDFLERGLDVIVYSNGHRVSISAYAEMALRTASQRATFLGEGKKRDEWGVYTVLMSVHNNCSPWCLPFQGTVLTDDVYTSISKEQAEQLSRDTGYLLLSYVMEQGAFHPNCRHTLATFFPGISKLPKPTDPEKAVALYEAEQKQRYMERQIRRYKRLEEGSLDESNQAKYGAKVKDWQARLRDQLAENSELRRDRRREQIS